MQHTSCQRVQIRLDRCEADNLLEQDALSLAGVRYQFSKGKNGGSWFLEVVQVRRLSGIRDSSVHEGGGILPDVGDAPHNAADEMDL